MTKTSKYPVFKIVWVDSESHDSWHTEGEIAKHAEDKENQCISIGFLVRKPTKKVPVYWIANTVTNPPEGTERQASCIMKIPAVCIKEIEELTDVY